MKAREAAVKDRDAELDDRHGRLETLEQALKAERTVLDGKAKVLAEDPVVPRPRPRHVPCPLQR